MQLNKFSQIVYTGLQSQWSGCEVDRERVDGFGLAIRP